MVARRLYALLVFHGDPAMRNPRARARSAKVEDVSYSSSPERAASLPTGATRRVPAPLASLRLAVGTHVPLAARVLPRYAWFAP